MSRSGYDDDYGDYDPWGLIRWRGAVKSATTGKRGQAFFRDLLGALDALPEKKLVVDQLEAADGSVCALGALGRSRGIDMSDIDPENSDRVSVAFGIADALAREVVYMNDEHGSYKETPEQRFTRIRAWVASQIKREPTAIAA